MPEPVDSRKLFIARSRRANGLVRPILLFMVAGALAQIVVGVLTGGMTTILVSTFCGLTSVLGLFLVRAGHARTAVLTALTTVMLGIEYAMWIGEGIHDVAAMELSVILLLAIVALPQRTAIVFHLIMLASVGVIGVAEHQRWLPGDDFIMTDTADAYLAVVILAALGGLLHYLVYTLARSEQSYAEVFNATHEAIFVHDAQTARILDVNDAMLRTYGYARDEVAELDVAALCADDPEFSIERLHTLVKSAAGGQEQIFEWKARRKDGTEFWVEVTLRRSDIAGQGRVLAVVRDIDARKQAEGRTRRAEKLRALGQLAGGIAHDFNNQLAGIAGYAELLALERSELPDVVERTGHILKAADHAANLTRQLLAFAREESQQPEQVDFNSMVADVVEMTRRSIDRSIEVRFEPNGSSLVVTVDPAQAHSAILNLCLNARDAMPNGGKMTIATSTLQLDDDAAKRAGRREDGDSGEVGLDEPRPGRFAVVEISDDGIGMSEPVRDRIFEPFFTTKARGTGMGLATVYGTARGHGGFVEVESEPGSGSKFRLAFPLEDGSPTSKPSLSRAQRALGLRVLVAEDEPILAEMTRTFLEQLGCRVHGCGDGEQAVAAFGHGPGDFDVVLLDLSMPRLSGEDALREIREIDAKVPVVVMSGYTADTSVESLRIAGAAGFVAKPFTLGALRSALATAVAARDDQATDGR